MNEYICHKNRTPRVHAISSTKSYLIPVHAECNDAAHAVVIVVEIATRHGIVVVVVVVAVGSPRLADTAKHLVQEKTERRDPANERHVQPR